MELLHMTDVLPLIGIHYPLDGRSSFYVACPCCDVKPNSKHLNINLKRDVFRCPRCGVSGGVFDLYALYTGVPRNKVRNELLSIRGCTNITNSIKVNHSHSEAFVECPITDVEARHMTYTALLSKLSLAKDHRENLRGRGLTDCEIDELGYKSTPIAGCAAFAKQLQSEGCYLAGVPGFYRTENGEWSFVHEKRGILIPVRDIDGRIQGLQLRRDDVKKRKFRWISSADKPDGCRAEGWTHLAGSVSQRVLLTEGPMKADVIHALTGDTVLAVPGVHSLTHLKHTLRLLREQGVREIKTAFDMDFLSNHHVQSGYNNLLMLLDEMGFQFGTYLWDPTYKGLDDYIWEHLFQKER